MKRTLGEKYERMQIILLSCIAGMFLVAIPFIYFFGQDQYTYDLFLMVFFFLMAVALVGLVIHRIKMLRFIQTAINTGATQVADILAIYPVYRNCAVRFVLNNGKAEVALNFFANRYRKDFQNDHAIVCYKNKTPIIVDIVHK